MKLVTAEQMRAVDREAIDNRGIPGPELMENAGRGIAERIRDDILLKADGQRVAIFCGKGNNGGDGFVVGRYLHEYGAKVSIYFPGPPENLSHDAKLNYDRAFQKGVEIVEILKPEELPKTLSADLVVDAVFGTGFSGAPHGLPADFIEGINKCNLPVVAVDCPSGLDVDTGKFGGPVTDADYTYTLALPKIGLYYSPGREKAGIVEVVPIGVPDDIIDGFRFTENLITPEMVAKKLPHRKPDGHKGDFGRLFILAGSTGLTGAATLSAMAAARSGTGLVTVGCPKSLNPILEVKLTEAMTYPLPDVGQKGCLALRGLGEIRNWLNKTDAAVIGPGLGGHRDTVMLMHRLIEKLDKPVIIDADGLNAFAKNREPLKGCHPELVLTPHPGEFRRLIDEEIPDALFQLYGLLRNYAHKYNAVIVFKGSPTVIVEPGGQLYLNPTGNNGMATGGTGDVLSGMIGAFLAQGLSPLDSAVCAVYLHGLSGDLAAAELGHRSLIAGDLIDFLHEAFWLVESTDYY